MARCCRSLNDSFYNWWYPKLEDWERQGGYRRCSRPARILRHCNRWLRRTWLGKKMGWLLDAAEVILYRINAWLVACFSWRRIRWLLGRWETWTVVGCVLAAAVGWFQFGLPRYRKYREGTYTRQAQQFLAGGDASRANLRARQVIGLNPNNPIANRIMADLADRANSPYALYWRQRLVGLEPDPTNRLALAKTSLHLESFPYPSATKALSDIDPSSRNSSTYHLVAGALEIMRNNLPAAEEHYEEALKLDPNDPVNRMSLAVVQLQSGDPRLISESRTTLELLRADQQVGLLVTRSLIGESASRKDFVRAKELSSQLVTNAQSSFTDRIVHLAILKASGSMELDKFLGETQKLAQEDARYVGELASWMNRSGFAGESLEWIKKLPDRISKQGLVPIALADAFVALERWDDLKAFLVDERWGGLDHVRLAMLTRADSMVADGKRNSLFWNQAILQASATPASLNVLAGMAISWNWKPEAEEVLWHATRRFSTQDWPLVVLQKLYTNYRDTAGLLRVFQTYLERDPKNALAKNNYAMISLLVGSDVPQARALAAELHATNPDNAVFTSTYAFSLYRQGRTQEALHALRSIGLDKLDDPAYALYYGVFLSAIGETNTAKSYLAKSQKALLLPEELTLVEHARKAM